MDENQRTSETERRRATILFADITGFTSLNERLDPEDAYALISACLKFMDEIAHRHGGSVDKYLGDCIMAVFGVPVALEDAPKAAINAAIEMHNQMADFSRAQAEELGIHSGINSGLVISGDISGPIVREFSIMGDAVNIAARLKDLAPAGQIWVGAETHRYTREEFDFRALEPLALKGKRQRVPTYEVVSRAERRYRPAADTQATIASELVGRADELAALRRRVSALIAGQGGVAALIGDAGIGKSRMIAEIASSEAADAAFWLQGRSLSIGANLSFHPFSDLLRTWAGIPDHASDQQASEPLEAAVSDLFGDDAPEVLPFIASVAGLRPSEAQRARLEGIGGDAMEKLILGAISRFLRRLAERGPVVVVLEDLHWADASSLELMASLLRLVVDHRILFLAVLRPEPPAALLRVREAAASLDSACYEETHLKPLDRGSAEQFIDNVFREGDLPHSARSLIEERTGGNPFYLQEVLRSLIDEGAVEVRDGALFATEQIDSVVIPGTVEGVIMSRIDRLSLAQKSVLQVAAIIGRSAYTRILASVVDREDLAELLEALTTGQLLVRRERMGEATYDFTHPLIQEVTYTAVTREKRADYHHRVAEAIEHEFTESHPGYYGMLAYHSSLGNDLEKAEKYLLLAGEQAAGLSASAEALGLLQEAAQLYFQLHGDKGDPRKRALLEQKIGMAFFNSGRMVEGNEHIDRALELLGQRVPRTTAGRYQRFAISFAAVLADLYAPAGLRRRRVPASEDHVIIEMTFARAQSQVTADPTRFLFNSMEGLRKLNSVDPTSVQGAGGQYAGAAGLFAYSGLSFGIGERFIARAESLVDPHDLREILLFGMMNFVHRFMLGDWDDRHTLDAAIVDENIRLGELWNVITYLPLDAKRLVHQGRFSQASEELEQISKLADLYAYDLARSGQLAVTMFLQLERRRLSEALDAATLYFDEFDEDLVNLLALATRAKIELLLAEPEAAEKSLQQAENIVRRSGILPIFQHSAYLVSRFWLDLLRFEQALAEKDRKRIRSLRRSAFKSGKRALAKSRKVAWHLPETHCLWGRCAWLAGEQRRALEHWQRSVAEAEQLGMRPDLARTYLEVGRALSTSGAERSFLGLDAGGCFERAEEIFHELDLAWDLEQLAATRKSSPSAFSV